MNWRAAEAAAPSAVTLALNAQNLALFTAGPLLADGLKQAAQFVGKLLAPTPYPAPLTWLPAVFRLVKEPLVPFQHVDWRSPASLCRCNGAAPCFTTAPRKTCSSGRPPRGRATNSRNRPSLSTS